VRYIDFSPAEGLTVRFVPLDTPIHFANYKAALMRLVTDTFLTDGEALCYFDPDVVVKGRWSFYEEWLEYGIALVEDLLYPDLTGDHPLRMGWMKAVSGMGVTQKRRIDRYYNSGFLGVPYQYRDFLTLWDSLMEWTEKHSTNNRQIWQSADRSSLFMATDQDNLNIAVMVTDYPVSTVGPDGMDFLPGGFLMSHAVNSPKPWNKPFLKRALTGVPPAAWDKLYWQCVSDPIRLFDPGTIQRKQRELKISSALGRFIRRPTQ
jgi:lipopolysaccharide biosynthesis glycosyltransferase